MPININNKIQLRNQAFNRGQNSNDSALTLKPGTLQLLENGVIDSVGDIDKRKGTTRVGDNPDSLISRWLFDNSDATDSKASNDGTVSAVTYAEGKFGKAAQFNGTSSSIEVAADTSIDVNSTGPFRLSAWIYVESDGENDEGRIFDKDGTGSDGFYLAVNNESSSTVAIKFVVRHATTDAEVQTSTTLSTEAWHKIDAVYNTDLSLDIYIDGVQASYSTDTSGSGAVSDDSANSLFIGNNESGTRTFDGKIDDARFYDGNFTAAELALDKIQGITRYTVSGSIDRVYRMINTTLQRLDDDFKGYTDIDTGFTADLETNFVQAGDLLFILNGTDNVHSMDSSETITDEGNTNTDPPLTTVGEYMDNNRLFLAGSLTASTRDHVWFSDTLAPQTFNRSTNVFKVRSGGGGSITALKQFRQDELIIYKDDSVHILFTGGATPLTDWTLRDVHPDIGCKAGRSVANLRNEQVYLDSEGNVRLLTRTEFDKYRNGVISDKIRDVLAEINKDQMAKSVGFFHNEKYYLFFPTGSNTEPNKGIVWDIVAARIAGDDTEGWSVIPDDNWFPSCTTEFEFSDNKIALIYGDNRELSLVHRAFNGNNDDGKAITMKIRGMLHTTDYARDVIWGPLHVVSDSDDTTELIIRASTDNTTYRDVATVSLEGSGGVSLPVDLPFNFTTGEGLTSKYLNCIKRLGRSKSISFEFEHNDYNKSLTFKEYTLWGRAIG